MGKSRDEASREVTYGRSGASVGAILSICVPRSLDRQIRNFEPHILYAWVADRLWAETVRETARRYQLPYVIHFMDSHVGLEASIPVEKALYPSFLSSLSDVVRDAEALYTISDSMGQAYKTQWNRPYEVFHGVIESRQWPWPNIAPEKPVQNSVEQESSFSLVFTGSVEQGQMIGLKEVATAVDELLDEGVSIRLVLYLTGAYAERVRAVLGKYRCLEIKAHPDFASLRKELATADALILAYGFDQFTRLYYKYSFATKIVPYMMSGRPILVYGPQGIEPVEYALRGDWSLCVTTGRQADEGRALKDGIRELMDDPERRKFLACSAWKAGAAEHDQALNADRFRASLLAKSSSLFLQIHSGFNMSSTSDSLSPDTWLKAVPLELHGHRKNCNFFLIPSKLIDASVVLSLQRSVWWRWVVATVAISVCL